MLLFIRISPLQCPSLRNFKTSYVTVYRVLLFPATFYTDGFQNIVCYCLSHTKQLASRLKNNFKTSYVTVYHKLNITRRYITKISKHRMLLFIKYAGICLVSSCLFQNIVCYCLSVLSYLWWMNVRISKHRMLLFI